MGLLLEEQQIEIRKGKGGRGQEKQRAWAGRQERARSGLTERPG